LTNMREHKGRCTRCLLIYLWCGARGVALAVCPKCGDKLLRVHARHLGERVDVQPNFVMK